MQNTIKSIVDYMIKHGTENTTSGNYIFTVNELSERFDLDLSFFTEYCEDILSELYTRDEILDVLVDSEINNDGDDAVEDFDLNFGTDYCPNVDDPVAEAYALAIELRESGDVTLIDDIIGYLGQALE